MISFIVIGLNEGKTLAKCLESIEKAISYVHLNAYEIIYVDSASTDNSIEIASTFEKVNIIKITGLCSVAIARNIGYQESHGDILFFFDADMELFPEFLPTVLDHDQHLKYDAVTGQLINNFYDQNGCFLMEQKENSVKKDSETMVARGVFLIKRDLFQLCNAFNTKYHNAWEDYDLVMKITNKGYDFIIKPEYIARHHTISYKNRKKMWQSIFSGKECLRGVLYRNHIFNIHIYKLILRNEYSGIILLITLLLSFITGIYYLPAFYILINFIRILIQKPDNIFYWLSKSLALFIRELSTIGGFLFYYPKRKELKYEKVRSKN